jgi:hypothetical protein
MIVQGCSCLQNITASAVSIGTNTVVLNTATPAVRFAGVSVQDSGSNAGVTGSIFWDGLCNRWIYSNPSDIGYSGGMLLSGPRTSTLGTESPLTCNYIAKSGGGDHLYDSCIIDDGTTVCVNANLKGSGTACFTGAITGGNTLTTTGDITISNTTANLRLFLTNTTTTTGRSWYLNSYSNGNLYIGNGTAGDIFNFSSSGVATFSSNITTTSLGIGLTACAKIQAEVGNTTNIGLYASSGLAITSGGGSTGNIYQISFGYGGGTYGSSALYGLTESATGYNSGALVFATRALTTDSAPIERMRISSGGNIGIGVTPCAWASPTAGKVIQIGNRASLFSYNNNTLDLATNFYFDGGDYRYIQSAPATLLRSDSSDGTFVFYNATSGTAGGVVSLNERMRITNAGAVCFASTICACGLDLSNTGRTTLRIFSGPADNEPGVEWWSSYPSAAERNWRIGTSDKEMGDFVIKSSTTCGSSPDSGCIRIHINNSGVACFSGTVCAPIATLSNYVQSPGLYGKSYSQTSSSGACSIVDTGIYNSIDYQSGAMWLVSYGGNPLGAGSNYFANYLGALSVTTGYIGGAVKQYIVYTPIAQFDASGAGSLSSPGAVFWNGTTETTTISNSSTSYQIRLKIGPYNPVGSGQYVYLLRMG